MKNKTTEPCFCGRVCFFFFFFIKAECHNAVSLLLGATSFHKPKNTVTSQSLCRCKHNAMSPSLRHAPPLNLEHNGDVLPQRGLRGETVEKWTDGYSERVCYIEPADSERLKKCFITSRSLSLKGRMCKHGGSQQCRWRSLGFLCISMLRNVLILRYDLG